MSGSFRDETVRLLPPSRQENLRCRCGGCACDPELLDPWLLARWLQSLSDRYAGLRDQVCSGRGVTPADPWREVWSVSLHVVHVAQVAAVAARSVAAVMAGTNPSGAAAASSVSRPFPAVRLPTLADSIGQLAAATVLIASDDWLVGIRLRGQLQSLELIRRALHEANHLFVEVAEELEVLQLLPSGADTPDPAAVHLPLVVTDGGGGYHGPAYTGQRRSTPRYQAWGW